MDTTALLLGPCMIGALAVTDVDANHSVDMALVQPSLATMDLHFSLRPCPTTVTVLAPDTATLDGLELRGVPISTLIAIVTVVDGGNTVNDTAIACPCTVAPFDVADVDDNHTVAAAPVMPSRTTPLTRSRLLPIPTTVTEMLPDAATFDGIAEATMCAFALMARVTDSSVESIDIITLLSLIHI